MEVYVNDMLVKARKGDIHTQDLDKSFVCTRFSPDKVHIWSEVMELSKVHGQPKNDWGQSRKMDIALEMIKQLACHKDV